MPPLVAQATEPTTLTIFAAGTLAVSFRQIAALFKKKYLSVTVQGQYGGSVMMARKSIGTPLSWRPPITT